ncbi:MAG TPA: HAMP domain-containing histidine kinase [Tepidimicrobium sp.]|nr:HAMP domain-containing histidine kinase [Tepidimicrobium sp.]
MLRNKEFKSIIIKLVILQSIFTLITFLGFNLVMDKINISIIERDTALIGNIIKDSPELEKRIVPYITKEVPKENIAVGQDVLRSYGYSLKMDKKYQPLLKDIGYNLSIFVSLLIFLSIIPLGMLIMIEYRKIYRKIEIISNAAERVVEGDFSVYLKEEGEGAFNILHHQFNQMANRLENTLDTLKKEKKFLKNSISDISHQLKTPLASLVIFNDLLLENEDMELKDRKVFLEKTKAQLERMEWLIINLLKIARIEAGAVQFKMERVNFKDVLDIALETLDERLKNQLLKIEGDIEGGFYGDRNWTGEALINIIKNSTEHSRGKIEIILEETPVFSNITIRDNGEGIDKKHLPHIFKRFYKVSNQVKPDSIGIGLNLSKLIIESQGGTISVKSSRDFGTEFTVTFLKDTNLTKM